MRAFLVAVAVLVIVGLIWTIHATTRILFPWHGDTKYADAVVSLAPSSDRIPLALELYEAGVGGALVVSTSARAESADVSAGERESLEYRLCVENLDPSIQCFVASPSTTLGEALSVRDLAAEHSWKSVTVVTSKYHAFRTDFIFKQCLGPETEVNVVHAESELGKRDWLFHIAYENAALVKAFFETRAHCR